jgi:hypothetical protein
MNQCTASLLRLAGVVVPMALTVLALSSPAEAIPSGGPGGEASPSCLDRVTASFSAWPSTVALGESTTLHWNVRANGCGVTQSINTPGWAALRRLRVIDALVTEAIGHHGLIDPGSHFLQKPFAMPTLLRKLRTVLEDPD